MLSYPYEPEVYTGNGATSVFAFGFKIWNLADLRVTRTDLSGSTTTLVAGIDYTVPASAIGAENGGSITLVAGALANGWTLRLESTLVPEQPTSFRTEAAVRPETIETSLDKLTRVVQQLVAVAGPRGENLATLAALATITPSASGIGGPTTTALRPAASALYLNRLWLTKDTDTETQLWLCVETSTPGAYEWRGIWTGGI